MDRTAMEFPTQKALDTYLKEHPKADKSNHKVKRTAPEGGGAQDSGGSSGNGGTKGKDFPPERKKSLHKKLTLIDDKFIGNNAAAPKHLVEKWDADQKKQPLERQFKLHVLAGGGQVVSFGDLERAKWIAKALQDGIKQMDACKRVKGLCEGNLGISRSSMPQISPRGVKSALEATGKKDFKDLDKKIVEAGRKFLSDAEQKALDVGDVTALAKARDLGRKKGDFTPKQKDQHKNALDWEKEAKAAVAAGADPEDDEPPTTKFFKSLEASGVSVKETTIPARSLMATQREINSGATFGIAAAYLRDEFHIDAETIPVSKDGYILDGHHRWSAMMVVNPDYPLKVRQIDLPMREILDRAMNQPGTFRMDVKGNVQDESKPIDQARKPGQVWQQKAGWYGKNQKGEASGPFKIQDAAKAYASGKAPKTASLLDGVIRLAHEKPEMRKFLVPLIRSYR